jgi:hypothetical protein
MTDAELVQDIAAQRALMIAVATGGPRIKEANSEYTQRRATIATQLAARGYEIPIRMETSGVGTQVE